MRAIPKAVELKYRFANKAEQLKTINGVLTAKPGDAILLYKNGDLKLVRRDVFEKEYFYDPVKCVRRLRPLQVEKMEVPFTVRVPGQRQPLEGKPGDYRTSDASGAISLVPAEEFAIAYVILDKAA